MALKSQGGTDGPADWKRADRANGDSANLPARFLSRADHPGRTLKAFEPNPVAWTVRPTYAIPVGRGGAHPIVA